MADTNFTFNDYAESLVKAKNYSTVTPEMHEELVKDVINRVQDFLIAKTIAKLTDDQVKQFNTLLDTKPTDEQTQQFISGAITDAPTFIGDVLYQFRQTYLGIA